MLFNVVASVCMQCTMSVLLPMPLYVYIYLITWFISVNPGKSTLLVTPNLNRQNDTLRYYRKNTHSQLQLN